MSNQQHHHSTANGFERTSDHSRHGQDDFDGILFSNKILVSFITIFSAFIQVRYPQANVFDIQPGIMSAVVIAITVIVVALLVDFPLRTRNSNYRGIVGRIGLLSGLLAVILLLMILVPWFGWTMLVIWFVLFLKTSYNTFQELYGLLHEAVIKAFEMLARLMDRASPGEQNPFPMDIP